MVLLASVSRGQDVLNILSGTGLPACHLHLCNVNSAKAKNAGLRKMAVPFMMRILFICSPLVVLGLHCNTGSPPVAGGNCSSLLALLNLGAPAFSVDLASPQTGQISEVLGEYIWLPGWSVHFFSHPG